MEIVRVGQVTVFFLLGASFICRAAVLDRVAVVVGNQVITESEVEEEVRVTAFQNQEPPDFSPEKRREAAERLVDQQLIRNEMEMESYQQPAAGESDVLLAAFRRDHFSSDAQWEQALRKYGITKDELKEHLLWQLAAIRFVDFRFREPGAADPVQSANRLRAGANPQPGSDNPQLDAWLKETRSQTRIDFKKEAFQ